MIKKRALGATGLDVSPLAFGGNVFGWTVDEKTSFDLLDRFLDAGFNFIDTADIYSKWADGNKGGESETVIGNWLQRSGRRSQVIIATKVGGEMGPDEKGLSRAYILSAVEKSLRRLKTDYIDLYLSHFDDPDTPFAETLEAYGQLLQQGKVRAVGASNLSAKRLEQALRAAESPGRTGYRCLQPLYNLYDREEFEKELAPVCRENGLGVMTYFSLASGFLTGKYRSKEDVSQSARRKFLEKYMNDRGLRIVEALKQVARENQATPATVALAWLISRPGVTSAIASATNLDQLSQMTAAAALSLDRSTVEQLDKASAYE